MTAHEIRSVAYGNLVEEIAGVESKYFARRKELIELGGDWTKEDLRDMLFEIFDSVGVLDYAVCETISGGFDHVES
jgi:hypothetical protein